MTSKFGYQVHPKMTYGRGWSADEQNYFWQHLERLQPAAMLFLDDDASAAECKRRLPNCAVVVRHWSDNEGRLHLEKSPRDVFQQYRNIPGDLIVNVGNEPSGYDNLPQLAKWYAELMDLFGANHQSIVVPNFGEGHPNENKLNELEPLWNALDKWHDLHYYAAHEYGTHRGMMFNEAGKYDVYPWRVGRFEALVKPYLEAHGHKVPRIILTECGIDDAHDGTNKRGWKDAGDEAWYALQLKAAYDAIYHKPHYVGVCLFSYGNSGKQGTPEDWRTFDASEARTLHAALEALAKPAAHPEPPPPVKPPVPPVITTPPTDEATRAKLEQLAARIEELSNSFDNMIAAIDAAFATFTKRVKGE